MKKIKKPIAILVNDIHLTKDNGGLVKNIINQISAYSVNKEIDCIIFGGDIFTNRSGQPLSCLLDFKEIIENCLDPFSEIHIIPGNHDKTNPNDMSSYLDVFDNYGNVYLHRGAEFGNAISGCQFTFIPFFSDEMWMQEFKRISKYKLNKGYHNFLVTHIGIEGVRNNDGTEVDSVIKNNMFENYDAVFVGHYHNRSKVGKNIYYTGSAYQSNYGEDIEKGFTVIYDDGTFKCESTKFPRYIKEVVQANDRESIYNLVEKYEGEEYNHIRFEIVGSRVDCEKVVAMNIEGCGIDCKYKTIEQNNALEIAENDNVSCYDKKTIIQDFVSFCKENNISGKQMQYGLKLIKEIKYVES